MYYFFFDWNDPIIDKALHIVCIDKLKNQGYADMGDLFAPKHTKVYYRDALDERHSILADLYRKPTNNKGQMLEVWADYEISKKLNAVNLSVFEAKALINWILLPYKKREDRIKETLFTLSGTGFDVENTIVQANDIIYDNTKVDLNLIGSIDRYLNVVRDLQEQGVSAYFRGHADCGFSLLPSVMRRPGWLEHECDLYYQTIIECPDSFSNCKTHLDYLVEMQHYGLPTRLLDVTKNPLIALYFACCDMPESNGEVIVFDVEPEQIKYPKSDTVSILASLPLFKKTVKDNIKGWAANASISTEQFNKKAARLLQEIKLEKPSFQSEIKKEDVLSCFFVQAEKKNSRIIKQDGAFIICGLLDEKGDQLNALKHKEKGKTQIYIIDKRKKKEMLQQLDHLSINHAQLFPEIQDVTAHIKSLY